jgi:hypothetical protein
MSDQVRTQEARLICETASKFFAGIFQMSMSNEQQLASKSLEIYGFTKVKDPRDGFVGETISPEEKTLTEYNQVIVLVSRCFFNEKKFELSQDKIRLRNNLVRLLQKYGALAPEGYELLKA